VAEALDRAHCSGEPCRSPSVLFVNSGFQLGQPISGPTIRSLGVKVGRTPDLMAYMEGSPSKVVVVGCGAANSAEHNGGTEADGADFRIGQSKHGVPLFW
jgi:hypothetical protein